MTKSLLALALVMTQLLSWSGSPVYLCLEGDGSFCLDAGPENCDCCHLAGSLDDHFSAASDERQNDAGGAWFCGVTVRDQHHQHGSRFAADCGAEHAPCGCTHIQISQQQSPAVLSPVAPWGASRVAALYAAPIGCLNPVAANLDAASRLHELSPPGAWPHFGRISVVLRC
jgi:hypothetical protein